MLHRIQLLIINSPSFALRSAKTHKISIENNKYLEGPASDIDHHTSCKGSPTANKWTPAPADTIQAAFRAHEIRRITLTPQDEMRAGMSRATSIKQSGRLSSWMGGGRNGSVSVDVYFPTENCSSLFNYSIAISVGSRIHVRVGAPADHINVHFREGNILASHKEAFDYNKS
ncbi:hypothetical protein Tco_0789783 [Tanacetum coccineum]